jgi:hypothetical protein
MKEMEVNKMDTKSKRLKSARAKCHKPTTKARRLKKAKSKRS